jgi:coenzyme F420-0:L-glutamate ligase/coenzyme F420-1:gamma-L-glutamate ligase
MQLGLKPNTAARLEIIALEGIGAIKPGDDLGALLVDSVSSGGTTLRNGDVIVVAQKAVSKMENRYVVLSSVTPSERAIELGTRCDKDPRLVEIILSESREVLRAIPGVLVVEDRRGLVLANAGVDRSNVDQESREAERVLLLPKDPDASAAGLRARVSALAGVDVGVIINDSLGRAWRLGTVGAAIGVAGLPGLLDRRGEPDLQGRRLEITEVGLADELAAAASVVMGQAAEGRPAVVIRGVVWPRRDGNGRELLRPPEKDLFR